MATPQNGFKIGRQLQEISHSKNYKHPPRENLKGLKLRNNFQKEIFLIQKHFTPHAEEHSFAAPKICRNT
jgi:hypothetical protein